MNAKIGWLVWYFDEGPPELHTTDPGYAYRKQMIVYFEVEY